MRAAQFRPDSPTAILKAAQDQVRELFHQYDSPALKERQEKNQLSHQIQQELAIQLEVEEVLLYPAVRNMNAGSAHPAVTKAIQDHGEIKALLQELTTLGSENRSLDAKMNALQHCVQRHLELEESQIFPLSETLAPATLQELGQEMEMLRDRLRMNQRWTNPPERDPNQFYPTLQDRNGAPEDDRDTPQSLGSSGEFNERHPGDFDNWGSE